MNLNFLRKTSSFTFLNITQFMGALNDNIYKLLIVFFLIEKEGIENSHIILSTAGAIFVLPFLLFSAASGTLADRFSKSRITVFTKILELFIMIGAVLTFYYESKWLGYFILFMLSIQSTIFSPCKYGMVPELVPQDKISKANGLMASLTFLAIILGTFLASFLLDITGKNFIISGFVCLAIAIIGLFTSFFIERTPPSGSKKKFNFLFITEIYHSILVAKRQPSLLTALFGSSFFLFLGSFVQLNMIPFAVQSLHLTDVQGGYLFLLTALGIGTGSVIAGKLSGKSVELGLPAIGGVGVAVSCYLVDLFSNSIAWCIPLVIILGLFGGIYQIPLDSYIQVASPKKSRGQIVAASNFLSFFGVLLSSGLLYLLAEVFKIKADKGFTVIGSITLGVTIIIGYQFFDYLSRLICSALSRVHFKTTYKGLENIPATPAIYVCFHQAWNDTLLVLGAQRRRMRFFIEQEQEHAPWIKRLYRLLRIVQVPAIEPLENNPQCLEKIRLFLHKGISVCIFSQNEDICNAIEKLKHSYSFREILEQTHFSMIPVAIEKGEKDPRRSPFITRMLRKIRVPASISFGSAILPALTAPALLDEEPEYYFDLPDHRSLLQPL